MAKITRTISAKVNGNGNAEILLRVNIDRNTRYRIKSGIFLPPRRFKDGAVIFPRANQAEAQQLRATETELISLERVLLGICENNAPGDITKEILQKAVDRHHNPEKYAVQPRSTDFFDVLTEYIVRRGLSEWRVKQFRTLLRMLRRFEACRAAATGTHYRITLDGIGAADLDALDAFMRSEPALYEQYPEIYAEHPADTRRNRRSCAPLSKGDNTIAATFGRLRAFFNWCHEQGLTDNRPFAGYHAKAVEKYGTPYYITPAERDTIAAADLSAHPTTAAQRDVFVFQCLVGCRVSDLLRLTPANVIDGGLEYIAGKTRAERPTVIRVPLHRRAAAIVAKYSSYAERTGKLLPFITSQRYNDEIKRIFALCGITRAVTTLDPVTGEERQRPLHEIASSHLARRTFIGNLYKQVKDPNLVGKLSGHTEGSKAFARYRDIDEDMMRDTINLLGD